jgi:hypothetical protein
MFARTSPGSFGLRARTSSRATFSRPKRADTLGKQLSRLIRRAIGLEVNPHLYRHLVHLVVLNLYPAPTP